MTNKLFLLVFLLFPAGVYAEIMAAHSIEWLTCKSEVVVIGEVKEICITKGEHSSIRRDFSVEVLEVLKGDVKGKDITFWSFEHHSMPLARDLMNSKKGVLLFLSKSNKHGMKSHHDNNYVPTILYDQVSIMNLSKLPKHLYSKEMKILSDKKEILDLVRKWADSKILHSVWSEVSWDSPIFNKLYAGSSCYLIVPAEEKYREQFLKQARSDKPRERQKAAGELYKFPGEETTRVLRELLKDDTENIWYFSADTISNIQFSIRKAAYESLKALGKDVPEKIQLERKPTEQEKKSILLKYWTKSFTKALPQDWKIVSVEAGQSHWSGRIITTSVIIKCQKGSSNGTFILIPKDWDKKYLPDGTNLGINGRNSQGGRYFFVEGSVPKEVKQKLTKYYGLER